MPRNDPPRSSFDRDAARQAWRQFARMQGVERGRDASGFPRLGLIVGGVMIAAVAVVAVAQTNGDEPSPAERVDSAGAHSEAAMTQRRAAPAISNSEATATPTAATVASPPTVASPATVASPPTVAAPLPTVASPPTVAAPSSVAESPVADRLADHTAGVAPHAVPGRTRVSLAGTSAKAAKAYLRVPKGRRDRAPVGAVGASGIHIDRISVGTGFANSRCTGPATNISIASGARMHACFRVVHLRDRERVRVVWEHDGRRVLQTRLRIPARHAFRTRSGLALRRGYAGKWRVRVLSLGGAELASAQFNVVR